MNVKDLYEITAEVFFTSFVSHLRTLLFTTSFWMVTIKTNYRHFISKRLKRFEKHLVKLMWFFLVLFTYEDNLLKYILVIQSMVKQWA